MDMSELSTCLSDLDIQREVKKLLFIATIITSKHRVQKQEIAQLEKILTKKEISEHVRNQLVPVLIGTLKVCGQAYRQTKQANFDAITKEIITKIIGDEANDIVKAIVEILKKS